MKTHSRRTVLAAIAAATLTPAPSVFAQAAFPSKPIRIIVPYAPGGFTDIVARLVGQKLSTRLGQPVIVENKTGGSTAIGAEFVAKAAPDGHTLLMGVTTTLSTNPFLFKKLPYKPSDFAPIALTGLTPFVLMAHPSLGAGTVKELMELAKTKPDSLNVATLGIGSSTHLVLAMFNAASGSKITDVPYKGSGPAMTDLLAGHIPLYFDALPTSLSAIKSGQLKPIAVTSEQRSAAAPAVPTFREAGVKDMVAYSWYGLLAPAATPPAVLDTLNKATNEAMQSKEIQDKMAADGALAPTLSRKQFETLIAEHTKTWQNIIAPLNISLD